jgi:hypothetical protein
MWGRAKQLVPLIQQQQLLLLLLAGCSSCQSSSLSQPPCALCIALTLFLAGYQVELFRKLALGMGWAPSDYYFSCGTNFTNILTDLVHPAGTCSVAATGEQQGAAITR